VSSEQKNLLAAFVFDRGLARKDQWAVGSRWKQEGSVLKWQMSNAKSLLSQR